MKNENNHFDKCMLLNLKNHSFLEKIPLLNNFSEIKQTSKLIDDANEVTRFYYSQKSVINRILENEDQIIEIINNNKYDFKFYFYLTLLIEDNLDIVSYSYSYDLIRKLDTEIRDEKESIKKLIESKIILVLIFNFRGFNRNKLLKNDLDNMEQFYIENIKNNKHILIEFNIDLNEEEIDEISLEEIYEKIISYIIKNKKLEDYDYTYNIINQLGINVIDITEKMFDELSIILNNNESYINDYSISNTEDLLDIKKINFYFLLFKYLLKDSQKIYNFPFLLEAKKIVINQIIKNSVNFNFDKIDKDIKERFEFNIKFILDSSYYYNIYTNNKNVKKDDINAILQYYKNYFFESKKSEITEIENGSFKFQNNMEEINNAKVMNEKYCIIEFIFNYKNKEKEKTESKIKNAVESWNKIEKMIKDKKLKKMRKDDKIMLGKFFEDINNKDLLIKIFGEDCYDNFKKESEEVLNKENKENKRNIDINALKEILKYYKTFLFESKAKEINSIENFAKTGVIDANYEEYLKDLEISKKYNIRFPLINYLYNVQNEEGAMIKNEIEVKEKYLKYESIEKMIKDKKLKKMRKEDKKKIFEFFNDQNNKTILLEIFKSDAYEFCLKASIDYINQNKKKQLDKEVLNKLEEVLKYYQTYMPQTKKEDINSIENIIKNNLEKYENYLKDYEIAKEMNLKTPLISLFGNLNDNEEDINKIVKSWKETEKMINDKKIKKMRGDNKKKLINFFKIKSNKDVLIKIFDEDKYNFFLEKNNIKVEEDNNQNINEPNNKEKIKEGNQIISENKNLNSNNEVLSEVQEKVFYSENVNKNTTKKDSKIDKNFNKGKYEEMEKLEYSKTKEEEEIAEYILNKSKIRFHTDENGEKMTFIYDEIIIEVKENNILIEYEQLQRCKEYFLQNKKDSALENSFIKFMEFMDEFEKRIKRECKCNYNLKLELEFLIIKKNKDIYDIQCEYTFFSPNEDGKSLKFKDENILINKTKSSLEGCLYLINEINDDNYKDIVDIKELKQKERNPKNESNNSTNLEEENQKINKERLGILSSENKVLEKYGTEKESCIGMHRKAAESIKELSNHYFISTGSEGTILFFDDKLEICENFFENLKDFKNNIYSTLEIKNNNIQNDKEIHIIGCCNKELNMFHFNFEKKTFKKENYEFPEMTCINCVKMNENNFVLTGQNSTKYFTNLFFEKNKDVFHTDVLKFQTFRGAIKISDTIIALSSNSILIDGKDKLAFYSIQKSKNSRKSNIEIKKVTEIVGYSFISSTNGLYLMSSENKKKQNKILFCACKKYLPEQKNGIVLVNIIDDTNPSFLSFYETENFEVYCFCPIFLDDDKNKNQKIKSDYILVGGFDVDRREGRIKLFKEIYDEKNDFNNIEHLQDIEIGFEGAVSSIIQTQKHGNILVSCYDGKIYLCNKINLDFYLKLDSNFV